MNKFKKGDKVINIITNKKGEVICIWDNREDALKDKGIFTRKYHVLYTDGTEAINSVVEIAKLPDILDKKEKEYLSYVIKPFKSDIIYITKVRSFISNHYYIQIKLRNADSMNFPDLKNNTMYKGMEENKAYTLKDLDL